MKNYYSNKILPLTIKQLKKAEQQLKSRKTKVYDSSSYEVIWTVARVVKLSGMDLKITDESDFLDLVVYPDPLKQATALTQGSYFRFSFVPKKNILKGGSVDGFSFQISGMKKVEPNQITLHLATCLTEKIGREGFKQKGNIKVEGQTEMQIQPHYTSEIPQNKPISIPNPPNINESSKNQQDITKYCRSLGSQFDIEKISSHFNSKFEAKQIERVLQVLSEKGLIMDLGLVYEWVGEQQ